MQLRITKQHSVDNQQGFTLLENSIALVVMMIVGLGAAGGFFFAIRYNSAAADRASAMSIAQSALEKFRAVPFTDASLVAGTTTATVNVPSNDGSGGKNYTVTTTIIDKTIVSGKTTIKSITIQVIPVNSTNPIVNGTYASGYEYYGMVKLFTERCNPLAGSNLH